MASPIKFDLNSASTKQFQSLVQSKLIQLKWSEEGDDLLSEYCVVLLANNKASPQIITELSEIVGSDLDPDFVQWLVNKGDAFKKGELDCDKELAEISNSSQPQEETAEQSSQSTELQDQSSRSARPSRSNRLQDQAFREISRNDQRSNRDRDDRRQQGRSQRRSRSPQSRELFPSNSSESSSFKSNRDRDRSSPPRRSISGGIRGTARASFSLKGAASREGRGDLFSQAMEASGSNLAMDSPGLNEAEAEMTSNYDQEMEEENPNDGNQTSTGARELLPPTGPAFLRNSAARVGLANSGKEVLRNQLNSAANSRNGDQFNNSNSDSSSSANLFGRMGVPNPKAGAFVPSNPSFNGNGNESSLLSRMNSNPNPSSFGNFNQGNNLQPNSFIQNSNANSFIPNQPPFQMQSENSSMDFSMQVISDPSNSYPIKESSQLPIPSKPSQSALCRYGLICTNVACQYAHPSPAAISTQRGNLSSGPDADGSALVLSEEHCRFQSKCSNKDCRFSHVSPAVAFLQEKTMSNGNGVGNVGGNNENTACRFKELCTNSQCPYAHFDPETGERGPSPALKAALAGNSQPANPLDRPLGDGKSEATPCRFGTGCTRPNCYYSHPPGRILNSSAPLKYQSGGNKSTRFNATSSTDVSMNGADASQISDRLSKFNTPAEENMERILPGQTTAETNQAQTQPPSSDRITDGDEVKLD